MGQWGYVDYSDPDPDYNEAKDIGTLPLRGGPPEYKAWGGR
jgi:hypothetical protein